jgi:hypothetical protein
MGIHNPVGGGPKDPYEEYRKALEKEKQDKETPEEPKKSLFPIAQIILWIQKILYRLIHPASGLKEHLTELKSMFQTLQKEDRSDDVDFSARLSKIWIQILDDYQHRNKTDPTLKAFIKTIQSYPEGQENTLGYYLSETVGQGWLPFPYIELIQKLHFEPVHLTLWIGQLDELIALLTD